MRIAILTSGILPVPAVQGGAAENLIDFYLEYNERHRLHDITVYSIFHEAVRQHPALSSEVNHYEYIDTSSWWARCTKKLYHKIHGEEYYHYSIEYFLSQAIKRIEKQRFDIIILENRPGYALKLKGRTNAQLIYHLHNDILNSETSHHLELYNAATTIVTVSDYIRQRVETIQHNGSRTVAVTVHNGIDINKFSIKKSQKTGSENFTLIFWGRITKEKGIKELIEAIALLQEYPQIHLLIIGSSFYGNNQTDDAFTKELKRLSEPIKRRITFTGFIPYDDIPQCLSQAEVAVIPSIWDDPFPTTVLEAQAAGLPIITTQRGGIPEEVGTDNAILLRTDDKFIENLAAAILKLYKNPELRVSMSLASAKRASLFNKDNYSRNFFKAIQGATSLD